MAPSDEIQMNVLSSNNGNVEQFVSQGDGGDKDQDKRSREVGLFEVLDSGPDGSRMEEFEQVEEDIQLDEKGRRPLKMGEREEHSALASLFFVLFVAGWNDATMGPLLLRVQEQYNITYTILSLTFVFNFLGFLSAALVNVYLTNKLGFGWVITIGAALPCVAYAIQAIAPPFPVYCITFYITGVGIGFQDAQCNNFIAQLPNMMWKMSVLHALYGIGALVSPLVSTQFSQIPKWHYFYLCSVAVAVINLAGLLYVFRLRTEKSLLGKLNEGGKVEKDDTVAFPSTTGAQEVGEPARSSGGRKKEITLMDVLRLRNVHILAIFTLIYVGIEITIGGWTTTYLIKVRHGGPNSGYISTGYYAGLTVGRVAFMSITDRIGEQAAIYLYTSIILGLEFAVWFGPSLIGGAIAVCLEGLFIGPHYVIIMSACTKLIPRTRQGGAIGWIAR
ncbi:Major facilitator superfamily domain, general substrate transporter [Phaffia rhodozyma]|uniref:Major facilitator superfamily domain, general substrate transporter n=1 Tax=Phaffia rhodozyma TaxID=264483 RepID=A0A0F7SJY9_PHARH|nr:Major facilitator superfamily domain, general substrate transporter [Phaffia rhodozyma]